MKAKSLLSTRIILNDFSSGTTKPRQNRKIRIKHLYRMLSSNHGESEGEAALRTQLGTNTQARGLGDGILQDNASEKAHLSITERGK